MSLNYFSNTARIIVVGSFDTEFPCSNTIKSFIHIVNITFPLRKSQETNLKFLAKLQTLKWVLNPYEYPWRELLEYLYEYQ